MTNQKTILNGTRREYELYRGDDMDKSTINYEDAMRVFEIECMLLVNERLHEKGQITAEMYIRAKDMILKS